jgi:hypothetical protein
VAAGAIEVLRWFAAEVSPSLSVPISSVVLDSGPRLDCPALGEYAVFGSASYDLPTDVGFQILGMQQNPYNHPKCSHMDLDPLLTRVADGGSWLPGSEFRLKRRPWEHHDEAFGPGLAGISALLNAGAQAGGAGGDQKAGLDAAGLGPLLQMAAMQMSLAQQQVSASGEGSAALAANANAALLSALASTQLATDGTVPGAALPALSSEGILHYLTALAALSAPGGAEGNVLYEQLLASAGLVGGVKGMCGKGAGVGGIKGAKGKPVPKGKGKAEKGKKSSPFEAEEVEVAATLALLRNPNPAAAVVARAQGGLDASGSAESYSSMVSAAAAAALAAAAAAVAAKGKGGTGVGLKKEAKRGSGSAGDMMRRASDCSDDGDDAAPSGAMVCMLSVVMRVRACTCLCVRALCHSERGAGREGQFQGMKSHQVTFCHAGRPRGATDAAEEDAQAPEDIGRRT